MKNEDKEQWRRRAADLPPGTRLHLVLTDHPHSDTFQAFGRGLQRLAPGLDLVTAIEGRPEAPWMETATGVRFHALPEGDKLERFAEALTELRDRDDPLPPEHRAWLDRMPLPATVRLYIAPGCPYCPQVLQQWIQLARAGAHLRLQVVDSALFPEIARGEGVKAVPTLVVDDHLRWSGRIPVAEVLEQLVTRDPGRLSAAALDGIIKEGRAAQVARTMVSRGSLFPAIVDLLTHDQWPVRLGAMVVMEEIAAVAPGLAGEVIPLLQRRYADLDAPVRGDVLHIIGETGDHRILPFLQEIARSGSDREVRQAATEAAETIGNRPARKSADDV